MSCAVVIPTHKSTISELEKLSLRNTLSVLSRWDIYILLSSEAESGFYESVSEDVGKDVKILKLDSRFMGSTEKYNFMGLSSDFYKLFQNYEYILICHLDSWVFRDELKYWIALGYDYIGAPLFLPEGDRYTRLRSLAAPGGGNGGLCLRRTEKMLEITQNIQVRFNYILFLRGIWFLLKNRQFHLCKLFIWICRRIKIDHRAFQLEHNVYEDVMISVCYAILDRTLRVAPPCISHKFALEVNMEEIINTEMKLKLPFGIHGYDKYISPGALRSLLARQTDKYSNESDASQRRIPQLARKPLVTVVTIVKNIFRQNRVDVLKQCIESVRAQSYSNVEHLIVDGASEDGTIEWISEYVDRGWVKLHSSPDAGVWDAMNKGLKLASGDFVNFLNSDDYFCDQKAIEIAVDMLIKKKADWFFSGATVLRADGSSFVFPTSLYGVFSCMGIVHQTMFVKSDILRAADPFGTNYKTRENYLMMLLIMNGFRYAYYSGSLVHYREGGFSTYEYGGENLESTKNDFSKYFYKLAGKRWRMSPSDCYEMFGWQIFQNKGIKYSLRVGLKLRIVGLKIDFVKRLLGFVRHHRDLKGMAIQMLKSL